MAARGLISSVIISNMAYVAMAYNMARRGEVTGM